jgi:hypothetical protein
MGAGYEARLADVEGDAAALSGDEVLSKGQGARRIKGHDGQIASKEGFKGKFWAGILSGLKEGIIFVYT